MAKPSKLARKIAAKARQESIDAALQRKKARDRQKERDARAQANAIMPDGYNPQKRAALVAASQRLESDPRARKIVERAVLTQQIEQVRRRTGIGNVSPPVFALEPADDNGAPLTRDEMLKRLAAVPPSVGEALEKAKSK